MNNETIEKHGVVVEHNGFKIGDEVFVKINKIKGIVGNFDKKHQINVCVLFDDESRWCKHTDIEHIADYELRIAREEFEKNFKGKKIRLEEWDDGEYIIFQYWKRKLYFGHIDDENLEGTGSAKLDWQILEEPSQYEVDEVIRNARVDKREVTEEPDLSKLAGAWCKFGRQIGQLTNFRDNFKEVYIFSGRYDLEELKGLKHYKFCKHPSKNPEDYKDIDTFLGL